MGRLNQISGFVLVVLFSILFVHALLNSIAALSATNSEVVINNVSRSLVQDSVSLDEAGTNLEFAQTLSPGNPRYLEGKIMLSMLDTGASEINVDHAMKQYLGLLNSRPAWPYTWVNYLHSMARTNRLDGEFDRVLALILTDYGHNGELRLQTIRIGLNYWVEISSLSKKTIIENIATLQVNNVAQLKHMLKGLEEGVFLCASVDRSVYEKVC